jgi:hypothetical protein
VTRLAGFVSHLFHKRARFSGKAVKWRMAVRQLKKFQGKFVALLGSGLRDVPAFLQAHEHPKNFANRAVQTPGRFAGSQAPGL